MSRKYNILGAVGFLVTVRLEYDLPPLEFVRRRIGLPLSCS
jgi:hypothetical protein